MKKYKVTKNHPEIQKGIIFTARKYNLEDEYISDIGTIVLSKNDIEIWVKRGYFEEIQEPEFTKNDMVDFALEYYEHRFYNTNRQLDFKKIDTCLEDWIKNINHD